ncbi:hypothetical protein M5E89_10225 [Acidaminococcus intestini]|nr:hypothetical protein M5E89_10225 [Acidaminococcus intestini]
MYLDVLTRLGVTHLEHRGLEVFPGKADYQKAEAFWQGAGLSPETGLVGFNIGSAVETKRWAPERFAAVADTLKEEGYETVFLAGPWTGRWWRLLFPR